MLHRLGLDAFGIGLSPGMLAFQIGDEQLHHNEAWGTPVCLDWYRLRRNLCGRFTERGGEDAEPSLLRIANSGSPPTCVGRTLCTGR
ncbi:hypothetical protein [Streptosporangium canum]|nr:hypothetical protein [Streptosporangium canum]